MIARPSLAATTLLEIERMDLDLLLVALAGFAASFVDGALGMGFGPTSSSILLNQGYSPAVVSTTVNLAKVTTGLAAAISHWRFDNIDHRLVLRLAVPGCVGALIGVTVLASVDADVLKPVLAGVAPARRTAHPRAVQSPAAAGAGRPRRHTRARPRRGRPSSVPSGSRSPPPPAE